MTQAHGPDTPPIPPQFQPAWDATRPPNHRSLADALVIHLNVVGALILRETRTRFGPHKLGFLWAYLQPMMFVGVMSVVFLGFGQRSMSGLSVPMFLITGFLPWMLFSTTHERVAASTAGNRSLLAFPQVTHFDCQIARALLELVVHAAVIATLIAGLAATGDDIVLRNADTALACLFMIWIAGYAFGAVTGAIVAFLPSFVYLMAALLRLLFFISGIFFSVSHLPPKLRDVILYNPLLHLIEGFRYQFTAHNIATQVSLSYALAVIVVLLLTGLAADLTAKKGY